MRYIFHLGHPAHFHLFKNVINQLKKNGHSIAILIKKKDILDDLLNASALDYYNILPKGRKDSKLGIIIGILQSDYEILKFSMKFKPDILIGSSYAISHVGKILKIHSINLNEDDSKVIPLYSKLSYPWASVILSPRVCDNGKWNLKSIKYDSYHELSYLHPNNFVPDLSLVKKYFPVDKRYFIIRFAKLSAHHDSNITGIDQFIAEKLVNILSPFGSIYITSERDLETKFEKFRIRINPLDIHHVMAFSSLFIGDSQTMAAEAAVLGIPFIRYNDFVDEIGYLNELEKIYQLGFGIKSGQTSELFQKVNDLVRQDNVKEIFQARRQIMLSQKIDFASYLVWFIENYPISLNIMKKDPMYQFRFK